MLWADIIVHWQCPCPGSNCNGLPFVVSPATRENGGFESNSPTRRSKHDNYADDGRFCTTSLQCSAAHSKNYGSLWFQDLLRWLAWSAFMHVPLTIKCATRSPMERCHSLNFWRENKMLCSCKKVLQHRNKFVNSRISRGRKTWTLCGFRSNFSGKRGPSFDALIGIAFPRPRLLCQRCWIRLKSY